MNDPIYVRNKNTGATQLAFFVHISPVTENKVVCVGEEMSFSFDVLSEVDFDTQSELIEKNTFYAFLSSLPESYDPPGSFGLSNWGYLETCQRALFERKYDMKGFKVNTPGTYTLSLGLEGPSGYDNQSEMYKMITLTVREHSYVNPVVTKSPTCTEEGEQVKTCEYCGDTITEAIKKTAHNWDVKYTVEQEPTCISEGKKAIHCTTCGGINANTVVSIPKSPHSWSTEYSIDKQPSCTDTGSKSIHCLVCCGINADTVLPIGKTEHSWGGFYTVDKQPTCSSEGLESIHCQECGIVKEGTEKPIGRVEHSYGQWKTVKQPTCENQGEKLRKCTGCGVEETAVISQKGHSSVKDKAVTSTCTKEGLTEGSHCSVCGKVLEKQETVPKADHSYGSWKTVKTATCVTEGVKQRECSVCGYRVSEKTGLGDHEIVKDEAVLPTCEEEGLTEGSHCLLCDEVIEAQKPVPAEGHTLKVIASVSPTYNKEGLTEGSICSTCGKVLKSQKRISKIKAKQQIISVKAKVVTVKAKKLKKKAQTVKPIIKVDAKGRISYKKVAGSSKLSINASTGKVTVGKKTKKGSYKIKVSVSAAPTSSGEYVAAKRTIALTIKVK